MTVLAAFTLQGRVVRLEPLDAGHATELAAAAGTDRGAYGYTKVPDGLDDAEVYVAEALAQRDAGRSVPFAVRRLADGAVVGSTRYLDLEVFVWPPRWPPGTPADVVPSDEHPPTVVEIGSTWYGPSARGTAVNPECKLLLLGHAFEQWGVLRVTLKTDARNTASRGAIERLGARFEGVRRAHTLATDGTVRDTAYYSVMADEWPAVRQGLDARLGPC